MVLASTRYIRKSREGSGWDVFRDGYRFPAGHGETKQDALRVARKMVRREGGGQIRVLNHSGKVTDLKAVRPSEARKQSLPKVA
jgi:hypothetical protein